MAVPTVFLNGTEFGQGRMSLEEILAKIDTSGVERAKREDRRQGPVRRASSLAVAPLAPQPLCMRRARASRHGRGLGAFRGPGARHHWASRTSSRSRKPKDRSSPMRSKSTCATTTSTS